MASSEEVLDMRTKTIRVPEPVHQEVQNAAEMLGYTPAELLEKAWAAYRKSREFNDDFLFSQKAFAAGDADAVMGRLQERRKQRASRQNTATRSRRTGERSSR
jgi:hypothetical protein